MKNKLVRKITFAGLMLAIVIVMQLLKNISAYISGPVINTVLVLVTLELGIWWGVGFSIIVPLMSLLISPASPMTQIATLTYGVVTLVIIIGNLLFIGSARIAKNFKFYWLIVALIIGALLKWGFMWACGSLVIKPLFEDRLGKLVAAITNVFSVLQLYSGLLSIVLIVPLYKIVLKNVNKKQA